MFSDPFVNICGLPFYFVICYNILIKLVILEFLVAKIKANLFPKIIAGLGKFLPDCIKLKLL
jgi:hypothetical protein